MATPTTELRKDLAALRLERTDALAPSRPWRWIALAGVAVLLAVGAFLRVRSGNVVKVETARVTTLDAPAGGPAFVPVLSGSGYIVSAERYVAIGVRVPGRIERYFVEEGDRVAANDPLVQIDPSRSSRSNSSKPSEASESCTDSAMLSPIQLRLADLE